MRCMAAGQLRRGIRQREMGYVLAVLREPDRGPAVPGLPADHLPGVQAGGLLAELVIFFNPPPGRRDGDQPGQRDRPGRPAPVIGQLAGVAVPPGQQDTVPDVVPAGGVVAGHLEHRPVVMPGALGPGPGAHPLPGLMRDHAGSRGGGDGAARAGGQDVIGPDRQHVAHLALADAPAQLAAAVDFIAGHEGGADPQGGARGPGGRRPAAAWWRT